VAGCTRTAGQEEERLRQRRNFLKRSIVPWCCVVPPPSMLPMVKSSLDDIGRLLLPPSLPRDEVVAVDDKFDLGCGCTAGCGPSLSSAAAGAKVFAK